KYSNTGAHLWSKRFGGTANDRATGVAVDASGNIVVVGYFTSTLSFGGPTLSWAGGYDIFVAKFNASGSHLWSKAFSSTDDEIAYSVAVDSSGNILLTGLFQGTFNCGGAA